MDIHRPQEAIRSFPIRERERRAHFPDGTRLALYSETGSGRSVRTVPRFFKAVEESARILLSVAHESATRNIVSYCPFNRKNQSFPVQRNLYVTSRDGFHNVEIPELNAIKLLHGLSCVLCFEYL